MTYSPTRPRAGLDWSSALRRELRLAAERFAERRRLSCYRSCGDEPAIIFAGSEHAHSHGNFCPASYEAILANPEWRRRLPKPHQRKDALPEEHRDAARELDSSNSSDALLMNVFCHTDVRRSQQISLLMGTDLDADPVFGWPGEVPLADSGVDRTEIDMKLGNVLVESKLTERDFTSKQKRIVDRYRGFARVFDVDTLPQDGRSYRGYQLIRNVLCAETHGLRFCLVCDGRRPDLEREWALVVRAIRQQDLRSRCAVVFWQELAAVAPPDLKSFLVEKYALHVAR